MTSAPPRWLRVGLWPFSLLYGGGVVLRNSLFDARIRRVERLPVPVISVGNLTVGGTGKTPLVMWLLERARAAGRKPGVLARGYGRAPGAELNEEGEMIAARFPDVPQVQNPDRVAGGQELLRSGVDLVVLDDGFQHRRVHRDCNVLCLDARFAAEDRMMLPAGRLREPLSGMRRADVVVLTRADALSPDDIEIRMAAVRTRVGRDVPVFAARHRPRDLLSMPGGEVVPLTELDGRSVALVSAVAQPAAVRETVAGLGAKVALHKSWRDHHRFTRAELDEVAESVRSTGARLVVTEKDEPKMTDWAMQRWVLRIDLEFIGDEPSPELLGLA